MEHERPVINDCIHHPYELCNCPAEHRTGSMHSGDHSAHDNSAHDHSEMGHEHSAHDHSAMGHDHSHHDPKAFRNQFFIALALTIPTMLYSHTVQMLLGFTMPTFVGGNLLPAILGSILFFTGGRVFLKSGLQELKSKQPGMMALISLAIVVAFAYSLFITVADVAGLGFTGMDFWWELATLIAIMLLGHWIEMTSIMNSQNAVGELAKLLPATADRIDGENTTKVSVSALQAGDKVLVRPGAAIPADGVILLGEAKLNESMITGEFAEVLKRVGDEVIAGTITSDAAQLGQGALTIKVTRVGEATMLSGIMRLVREAQASKSKTQVLADKAAGWLFYLALGSAITTAIVWIAMGTQTTDFILERVVTVLVIACPHALGLAIPLVTSISASKAARTGLLIRNRLAFEEAAKVDVVLFDKTGTLTTAERGFVAARLAYASPLMNTDELVALAAGVELSSEHSIGKAIVNQAKKLNLQLPEVLDFRTIPGQGATGVLAGDTIIVGGAALLTSRNIAIYVDDLVRADAAHQAGNTVVFVVRNSELLGSIEVGDVIRPESKQAVHDLLSRRIRVAMITGDANGVAESVAKELGITEVFSEVLPHQKADIVRKLQADRSKVAMVGDGVNDAPALAQANVGIAIGAGTDVAIESAGLVLLSNDPTAVAKAIDLSKRSVAKMTQNLWWAAGYNLLAIPLAAGALMPIGFVLSPALGAVLMSLSTIIVAANAQLLRK